MKTMYLVRSGATVQEVERLQQFFVAKDNVAKVYTSGIFGSIQTARAVFPERSFVIMQQLSVSDGDSVEVATYKLVLAIQLARNRMWENTGVVAVGHPALIEGVLHGLDSSLRGEHSIQTGDVVQLTFRRGGFFDAVRFYKQPFLQ